MLCVSAACTGGRGNRLRTDHPVVMVEKLHHSKRCKSCEELTRNADHRSHRKIGKRRQKAARTYTSRKTHGTGNLVEEPCGEDSCPPPYPRPALQLRPLHYPLSRHTLQHRILQHFHLCDPLTRSTLLIEQRCRSVLLGFEFLHLPKFSLTSIWRWRQ